MDTLILVHFIQASRALDIKFHSESKFLGKKRTVLDSAHLFTW